MLLLYILNKCSGNILVLFCFANMGRTGRSMPHLGGGAQLDHRRVVSWRVHRRRVRCRFESSTSGHRTGHVLLAAWCVIAGLAFLIWGIEVKGRAIEEIDAELTKYTPIKAPAEQTI